jgi:hypothetical protein
MLRRGHQCRGHFADYPSQTRQPDDSKREGHQYRYVDRHSCFRVSGPHSSLWSSARSTPQHGPPHLDYRPRRLAPDRLKIAKADFDAVVRDGTARPSESSWSSALHIVPKKDNGWVPCGDYRALNARTIPTAIPFANA